MYLVNVVVGDSCQDDDVNGETVSDVCISFPALLCPDLRRDGHYEMTGGVCLSVRPSVRLSVACLYLGKA